MNPEMLLSLFIGVGMIFMGNFAFAIYKDPELMEAFLAQLVKFEQSHIQIETESWKSSIIRRPACKVALPLCKMVRLITAQWIPILTSVASMLIPSILLNIAGLYPSKLVLIGLDYTIGHFSAKLANLLQKCFIFGWNCYLWHFP